MKQYTQSNLSPGNCWQTAVACILEVPPDQLPPQVELEAMPSGTFGGWGHYSNILRGYLYTHHSLEYVSVYARMFGAVRLVMPYHVMSGPTVRSQKAKEEGLPHANHAVVGRDGELVWDPHPSRDGLLSVDEWGAFSRYDPSRDFGARHDEAPYKLIMSCLCPACNLDTAREWAARRALELQKEEASV